MPVPQTIRLNHILMNTSNRTQKVNVHDVDHFLFLNTEFEGLIYLLQDLTTEQNLEITKEGLDRIIQHINDNFISNESIDCELQNNYDQGYSRGYADGKDEGYEEGYSEGGIKCYEKSYEAGKKDRN